MSKKTTFNLAELSYNNTIQVRLKVDEDGVITNHRSVCDSRQDLSQAPQLVQDIAAEFPFTEHTNPDGACCWADFIRVVDAERHHICYQESKYIYKDGAVTTQQKQPVAVVHCLDDLSEHPEKVQRFCNIVFTDEVKAAEQARLDAIEAERIAAEEKAAAESEAKRIEAEKQAVENAAAAEIEAIRKQEEFQAAVAAEVERQLKAQV